MKRLNSTERAQKVARLLNDFKVVFPSFTAKEMETRLKSVKCPSSQSIFNILRNTNQITGIDNNKFKFVSSEPVYFKSLQKGLEALLVAQKAANKKYVMKKSGNVINKEKVIEAKIIDETTAIEHAISLLKKNGYKISKPIIIFEEI